AVRKDVGHQPKSFVGRQECVTESIPAESSSTCHGIREQPERQPCGCIRESAGFSPDSLQRTRRTNHPYSCDSNSLKNPRRLLLGPIYHLRRTPRPALN